MEADEHSSGARINRVIVVRATFVPLVIIDGVFFILMMTGLIDWVSHPGGNDWEVAVAGALLFWPIFLWFAAYTIIFDGENITYRLLTGRKTIAVKDVSRAFITHSVIQGWAENKPPFRLVFIGKQTKKSILEINIKMAKHRELGEFLLMLDQALIRHGIESDLSHSRRQIFGYKNPKKGTKKKRR